jgi:hypothetical protein
MRFQRHGFAFETGGMQVLSDGPNHTGHRGMHRSRDMAHGFGDGLSLRDMIAYLDDTSGRRADMLTQGEHDLVGAG